MGNNIKNDFADNKCCGCGACVNACPTYALKIGENKTGFIVPVINEDKCIGCEKCIKVCPYHYLDVSPTSLEVYAVVNKSESTLVNSSSGGVFPELAKRVLKDGGLVFGCTLDGEFKARHIAVDSEEKLISIMRSKYIQSYTGDCYRQVKTALKNGKKILFSGTPCMVAGLKSFLGKDSNNQNLITIDVVCHGISSQALFNDYLENLNKKLHTPVLKYTFRSKDKAKNGMQWKVSYETCRNKYVRNWPEDSYNYYYMMGYTHRDSCYECPFASPHRYSDITLCDYWNWDKYSLPFETNDSVSGVIVNSNKGSVFFNKVKQQFRLAQSDFESLSRYNGGLVQHGDKPKKRDEIINLWKNGGYEILDAYFKENNMRQILKYRILRMIPYKVVQLLHKLK